MVNLFDGIEYFFNAIREKCSNDEEYAAEILKARGFLLEDEGLILSDNSHRDDAAYLNELLAEDNIGEVQDSKVFIFPGGNVENIFYSKNISGCEAFSSGETWKKFVHNNFAPKISLRFLEPFVGRYIKAISACGVGTWCSCDGNHPLPPTRKNPPFQKILIDFVSEPHELWHYIIFKRILVKRFKFRWQHRHGALTILFNQTDKWQTYTELNRAGEFLYNNRIKLRQIRREASNGISSSMTKHLPAEELAKIFSERANKLFDDLFKDI